jgi:hypothetical protein
VPDITEEMHSNSDKISGNTIEENIYYTDTTAGTYLSNPLEEKLFVKFNFVKQ